jgi:hypothetical protein
MIMKLSLLVLVLVYSKLLFSQLSMGAGTSMLFEYGNKTPFLGLHISGEYNNGEERHSYGKLFYTIPQVISTDSLQLDNNDVNAVYYGKALSRITFNYSGIEFGKRLYFGEKAEYGFSAYGSTNVILILNQVKRDVDKFDEVKFKKPTSSSINGSWLGIAAGINGGVQHAFVFGTVYLDASGSYLLTAFPSNQSVQDIASPQRINFNFTLGIKKVIFYSL